MHFITSYCRINGSSIRVNGNIFENKNFENNSDPIDGLYDRLSMNYPKFFKMDALSKLGIAGAECLFGNRQNSLAFSPEEIAVILSNSDSSEITDKAYNISTASIPSPSLFVYTLPNIVAGEICIRYHIKGENAFFVNPFFDAPETFHYTELLLETGRCKMCLTGWVNVNEDGPDLFLYTVQGSREGFGLIHSPENINELFNTPWKN